MTLNDQRKRKLIAWARKILELADPDESPESPSVAEIERANDVLAQLSADDPTPVISFDPSEFMKGHG